MKRRLIHFFTILVLFILLACSKEKYSGMYPLSDELKFLLPIERTYNYYSTDSVNCLMNLSDANYFYMNERRWDSDDGGVGQTIYYTGDFEANNLKYTSDLFSINYFIYVDKHGDLQQDVLDINIDSHSSGEIINIHIEMPLPDYLDRGYKSNINFADSLTVNNVKLFNIYYTGSNDLTYYLQEEKGLVAFEFDNEFWMLSE